MIKESVEPLLEREDETLQLRQALREAKREHRQIALIEAPAGIGKTSLLWAISLGSATN